MGMKEGLEYQDRKEGRCVRVRRMGGATMPWVLFYALGCDYEDDNCLRQGNTFHRLIDERRKMRKLGWAYDVRLTRCKSKYYVCLLL